MNLFYIYQCMAIILDILGEKGNESAYKSLLEWEKVKASFQISNIFQAEQKKKKKERRKWKKRGI